MQSDTSIENLELHENQCNQLEWKYLSTYASNLATVKSAYEAAIDKIDSEITNNFMNTIAEGLEAFSVSDEFSLIQKMQEDCLFRSGESILKLTEIKSTRTLLFVLKLWFNKLSHILKTLLYDMEELKYFYENVRARNQVSPAIWRNIMYLVNSVYDCHLSGIRVSRYALIFVINMFLYYWL